MSSAETLREFVNERLSVAAEEIFAVFIQTIAKYEEEIDSLREQRYAVWKPEIRLHRIELPQQHVWQEEEVVLAGQQGMNREVNSSLDQEEPAFQFIKEEEEELCTTPVREQLALKQETDTFMLTPAIEESDEPEPELNGDHQLLIKSSHVADSQDQIGDNHEDSVSIEDAEPKKRHCKSDYKLRSNNSHVATEQNQKRGTYGNSRSATNTERKPTEIHCKGRIHNEHVNSHTMLKTDCNTRTGKNPFKCDTCGKVWIWKSQLERHMRSHKRDKSYLCNVCGERFCSASALDIHVKIHKGVKLQMCKTCGKSFRMKYQLVIHARIHTGEKPYACKTCGKRFSDKSNLNKHLRIHSIEKPYCCTQCYRSFRSPKAWMLHMRNHTDIHSCKECGKVFLSGKYLQRHMKVHSGEKRCFCETCGKAFTRHSDLNKHMRIHTGEKPYSSNTSGE